MLPSYVITEAFPRLLIEGGLCVEYSRGGPLVKRSCPEGPIYLAVEPYRGVRRADSPAAPFRLDRAEMFEFYVVDGFGLSRYRIVVRRGKASMRRLHEIDLFTGFVKAGEYKPLEKAFENYVRDYVSSCIFGCLASLAFAGLPDAERFAAGLARRDKIYYAPGLALYIESRGRSSAIVEIAASTPRSNVFRDIVMRMFEEARGLHWAYMGRLTVSTPSLFLDVFMPRVRKERVL